MKVQIICLYVYISIAGITPESYGQTTLINYSNEKLSTKKLQLLYSPDPNHRELVLKSFELAVASGLIDTLVISHQEINDRLKAYNEDFEKIPGNIGEHFPNPWDQGPDFDFFSYYPFSKIPYGSYRNSSSGWYREKSWLRSSSGIYQNSIPESGNVQLKVYDVLGNEVATLVNESKTPGSYAVEFFAKGGSASGGNAAQLAIGVYIHS